MRKLPFAAPQQPESDNYRNEAEAVIGYLQAVGIRAHLRYLQGEAISAAIRNGRVALQLGGFGNAIGDVSYSVSPPHEFGPQDLNRDAQLRDILLKAIRRLTRKCEKPPTRRHSG